MFIARRGFGVLISLYFVMVTSACGGSSENRVDIIPSEVLKASNGIVVSGNGSEEKEFIQWESESTVNNAINSLRETGGGTIYFAKGNYEIRQGILVRNIDHVRLVAAPGVRLTFPGLTEIKEIRLTKSAQEGDTVIEVSEPQEFRMGRKYQIYPADKKGDRILEFVVSNISDNRITLARPIKFMQHVSEISADSLILEEYNFFKITGANDITIQGFEMDGKNVGSVAGHTIYCGILGLNYYKPNLDGEKNKPITEGFYVYDNIFRDLMGRGVAVYSVKNLVYRGNQLININREAMEVDHFSSAEVINNTIDNAFIGIALNDAYDTSVANNTLQRVNVGILFSKHFNHDWVNKNITVVNNTIENGNTGIQFDYHEESNSILNNYFPNVSSTIITR